jgi:tetratricopeptide (TPR) repeat protein
MLGLLMTTCAGSRLTVESVGGQAEVYVVSSSGAERSLGQTPLNVELDSLFEAGQPAAHVEVRKGTKRHSVLVPKSRISAEAKISVGFPAEEEEIATPLKEEAKPLECPQQINCTQLARGIAEAQDLIMQKKYDLAEAKLVYLSGQYSLVSVILDLLGNVYFLKKDLQSALDSYQRSLNLEPENTETQRVVMRIKGMLGSTSASQGGN